MKNRGSELPEDKYDLLGPAYADIGGELAQIVGGDPDRTFLYVEVGDRWLEGGVFKDEGDSVRYYDPSQELSDLIWKAWNTEEPNKRWSVMGYEITGTKFNARFKFPDEVDVEIYDADRRRTALKNHFGDKPVIYPPPPGQ
jgi:hypothetical protein